MTARPIADTQSSMRMFAAVHPNGGINFVAHKPKGVRDACGKWDEWERAGWRVRRVIVTIEDKAND